MSAADKIKWFNTEVKYSTSRDQIYKTLKLLPNIHKMSLSEPIEALDDIECEFVYEPREGLKIPIKIVVQPSMTFQRIMRLKPYKWRMKRTEEKYSNDCRALAQRVAGRHLLNYLECVVQFILTSSIGSLDLLLSFVKVSPDGKRVVDLIMSDDNIRVDRLLQASEQQQPSDPPNPNEIESAAFEVVEDDDILSTVDFSSWDK